MKKQLVFLGLCLLASCGEDEPGLPDGRGPDPSERGGYLVNSVLACSDCHTPRLPNGGPDMSRFLAGVDCLFDVNPPGDDGIGCINSRNLTNHPTGLMTRTDAQIKKMFLDGIRPDGKFLSSVMPYSIYHNLTPTDADAIVAYLRTVPGVERTTPPNEPPFDSVPAAATPIDDDLIPPAGGEGAIHDSAVRGRYLASLACIDCHTPENPPGAPSPIDVARAFQGGRAFPAALIGVPSPPFPEVILSRNLTPHASGLEGFTAADVVKVIKLGKDRGGQGVCPPMPAGPMGAFGGMTDADATDIANYLLGVPPVENVIPGQCVAPSL